MYVKGKKKKKQYSIISLKCKMMAVKMQWDGSHWGIPAKLLTENAKHRSTENNNLYYTFLSVQ